MRPIDTIREKLDSDFIRYHNVCLCKIQSEKSIKSIAGVGLCAIVSPIHTYMESSNSMSDKTDEDGISENFPVVIVNRTGRWFESNISQKYYVMVINPFHERRGLSPGFLVPQSVLNDRDVFEMIGDPAHPAINADGENLQCRTKHFIAEDT